MPLRDLTTLDAIAGTSRGDAQAALACMAGNKVLDTLTLIASVLAGSDSAEYAGAFDAALSAMADLVVAQGTALDLTDENQIKALISDAAATGRFLLTPEIADGVATILAAFNSAVEAAGSATGVNLLSALSAIALVAQGAAATTLKDLGDGLIDVTIVIQEFTGTNLDDAISEAKSQTGDVDGPTVQNAPQAIADAYLTNEDTVLIGAAGVLENDIDFDGDQLTPILVSDTTHGTLAFNSDGSFIYTPDANYNGPDMLQLQDQRRKSGQRAYDGHHCHRRGQRSRGHRRSDKGLRYRRRPIDGHWTACGV